MNILHLTLTKKWFDMIASGEKKEEYREMKQYWAIRLFHNMGFGQPKQYDIIRFKNGYQKNCPEMDVEWKGCWEGEGNKKWGAKNEKYYVIGLGEILSIKNYEIYQTTYAR
jgi:hypothetical protein